MDELEEKCNCKTQNRLGQKGYFEQKIGSSKKIILVITVWGHTNLQGIALRLKCQHLENGLITGEWPERGSFSQTHGSFRVRKVVLVAACQETNSSLPLSPLSNGPGIYPWP